MPCTDVDTIGAKNLGRKAVNCKRSQNVLLLEARHQCCVANVEMLLIGNFFHLPSP
jgi:hypothetical protein